MVLEGSLVWVAHSGRVELMDGSGRVNEWAGCLFGDSEVFSVLSWGLFIGWYVVSRVESGGTAIVV